MSGEISNFIRMYSLSRGMITEAFKKAFMLKDEGKFAVSNTHRSAKFVYEVAEQLHRFSDDDDILYVQKVDDSGVKKSGEWMYDITIAENKSITDPKYPHRRISFISTIKWAVESEYSTSLREFSKDFSKLLIGKPYNILYLNGLDQADEIDANKYIMRRIETTEGIIRESEVLSGSSIPNIYMGFWPTPQKVKRNWKNKSQWDFYVDPGALIKRVRLYKYNTKKGKFEEH